MHPKRHTSRAFTYLLALLLVVPALGFNTTANAAQMTQESLTLGTSAVSAVTTHEYTFNIPTGSNIGSIMFEYCDTPFIQSACTPPPGMDASAATLDSESAVTGFSVDAATNATAILITRPSAAVAAPVQATYIFGGVVNPSVLNSTFFVRISTFSSSDGTGALIDDGAVAFSTSGSLGVGGFVPPYLTFCVGITVADRCESSTGSYVTLGELSSSATRQGQSQFAAATNYDSGYTVSVLGTTMTSGNKIIDALATPATSQPGASQFGINLRSNTSPVNGLEVTGIGSGVPSADYGIVNQYKFTSGDVIAGSSLPTDFNTYTVSYIVNISDSQSPGLYSTTLQYLAVAQF